MASKNKKQVETLLVTVLAKGATVAQAARQAGVSERDCELIRGAFVYEGFGYDLTDPNIATDDAEELPYARPRK